jgi:hypothetical protein
MLAQKKDRVIIVNKGAVRIGDLQLYLNQERPTAVHFSGHGSEQGEIILEDNLGNARAVPPEALARLFEKLGSRIHIVVLNACYSAEQASVISQYVDCVVGMAASISDKVSIAFSSAFYLALAFEKSVKEAYDQGIIELTLWRIPEEHIPQLLVRQGVSPSNVFLFHENTQPATQTPIALKSGDKQQITYCRRCGALPGQESNCIGLSTHHDFTTGSGMIYCRRCGVVVGKQTYCIGLATYHDFTSGSSATFCQRCGVLIGERSECKGLNTVHDFVSR